ncbi:MAG: Trk system potassium transporter TrkA [Lachnospiraceae bacterium]|nr:Trk system potassium transporter TrkA [Lachnospiraceae bacterium]
MKIIIAGCGRVGYALAQQLNDEGHELTLIDNSAERLQPALSNLDLQGVVGNASSFFTLQEAGIGQADLLIAVTNQDEINLISCLIAKKASRCRTIARVRNPEYFREINYLKECMDISMIINPEFAAATEIAQLIQVPDAMEIDSFAKGKVDLMQVVITEDSPLHNMKVQDFSNKFNHEILICILVHDHQVCIPNGHSVLSAGDTISIILPREKINSFYRLSRLAAIREIHDVMLAGGGMISYYLAKALLRSGIEVKIIEKNRDRCDFLSDALPKATIIHSDATDHELLLEEGLEKTDAFVSLTALDEENIFLSLYANKMNITCKKITKVNRLALDEIINDLPIGSIISPKNITTEYILQYVRSQSNSYGSNVEALYRLMDNQVEALEFLVKDDCAVTDIPFINLNLKKNLLICCIVRNGKVITPTGRDFIRKNDKVIVVTTNKGLQDISDIMDDPLK